MLYKCFAWTYVILFTLVWSCIFLKVLDFICVQMELLYEHWQTQWVKISRYPSKVTSLSLWKCKESHLMAYTMVFPVVMCGCESWTVKKAEHRRIDAFEVWCWRRLQRVPWTARRSNQSILKEISPGISLEGLMLKLKLQYFGHLM